MSNEDIVTAFRAFLKAEHARSGDDFWAHAAKWNTYHYAQGFVAGYSNSAIAVDELVSACLEVNYWEVCSFCERVHNGEYFKDKKGANNGA